MNCKDKRDGLSREGSGRVGIYRATNLTNCYTLECSYHGTKKLATLATNYDKKARTVIPEPDYANPDEYLYEGKVIIYLYIQYIYNIYIQYIYTI